LAIAKAILEWLSNPKVKESIDKFSKSIADGKVDETIKKWKIIAEAFAAVIILSWGVKAVAAVMALARGFSFLGTAMLGVPGIAALFGTAMSGGSVPNASVPGGIGSPQMLEQQRREKEQWDKDHQPGDKRNWWQRTMPTWLGGKSKAAGFHEDNDFYDSIIKAEGTAKYGDPYNTSLGYMRSKKPLTDMTMDEVLAWGNQVRASQGMNSSAKGAFQIVNSTQRLAMEALGLKGSDKFSVENQQRMASWIAHKQGLGAWEGFKVHPDQLARARRALSSGSKGTIPSLIGSASPVNPVASSPFGALAPISPNAAGLSAGSNVHVTQTQTNNITGVSDPAQAASQIGFHTKRLNADALRNLQGAID
jgi:hypothetical protein